MRRLLSMARYVSTDLNTIQVKLDDLPSCLSIRDTFVQMFYNALGSGIFAMVIFGYREEIVQFRPELRRDVVGC